MTQASSTLRDDDAIDIAAFHRMAEMLANLDVGLVVLDRGYQVRFWNTFMTNHSGQAAHKVAGQSLFGLFPELDTGWFRHKVESVFLLHTRAFTRWEQRPWIFRFGNHRPLTSGADAMYQNAVFIPLAGLSGGVEHVAIMVYDVTETALNRTALAAANLELETLSRTDRLTGLNNRAHWEECVIREFRRFQRAQQKIAMVMFDIDHFKKVNDTYGHLAGDAVIAATAQTLKNTMRDTDIAGRYGGEEFGVVLHNTTGEEAAVFAERLRQAIQRRSVVHDAATIGYTISLGIAELNVGLSDHKKWMERADRALYRSKQTGRDRWTIYDPALM